MKGTPLLLTCFHLGRDFQKKPSGMPDVSSPANALIKKPRTRAGKNAARNLVWPDQPGRIASIMIGGKIMPMRNGAVSRNKSIGYYCLSVLRNIPPTTAPLLKYIHPFVEVRECFSEAMIYGIKRIVAGEASAGSADV